MLQETLLKLEALRTAGTERSALNRLRVALLAMTAESAGADADTLTRAHDELLAARERLRRLEINPATRATLIEGAEQTYRRGRKAMTLAYDTSDDEAFHAWRKCVQAHWRHMVLLARLWPATMDARAAQARGLSQILGDDHDLSLLKGRLDALGADDPPLSDAVGTVLAIVAERQAMLRRLAKPRGALLYAATPRGHGRWLAALWEAAADQADADKDAEKAGFIAPQPPKKLAFSNA